jgi:ATP-dependent Zn protease
MDDFEMAKDNRPMGVERSLVMPEEERRNTAYTSPPRGGRQAAAQDRPGHKVTIIRAGALA